MKNKYSTIINISIMKAIGPFRLKYTNEVQSNILIPGESYTCVASETTLASEAVLGVNWNTPEDDAAWADL